MQLKRKDIIKLKIKNNMSLIVNVVNKSKHRLPEYEMQNSAGMDLKADIRSRSGLAFKYDITAFHGLIDADYRGEIKVKLFNHSDNDFLIHPGERIAQLKVAPVARVEWNEVSELDTTERGAGGFGSTGVN